MKKIYFEYQYLPTIEDVHQAIRKCEGVHSQQTAFSTFHDALTQICFGCRCVRSTIKVQGDAFDKNGKEIYEGDIVFEEMKIRY